MTINYYKDISDKTRFIDPRIKDTELYDKCHDQYINQRYNSCEYKTVIPNIFSFKSKSTAYAGLGVRHDALTKRIIQMKGDYCLTYSEVRKFNTKHNIVNLDIEVEFLLGEKIKISAFKSHYGVLLKVDHYKVSEIDNSYIPYAHIPTIAVDDFQSIPFGEIFLGCYPETVQMFEDYYSGEIYPQKLLKKQ